MGLPRGTPALGTWIARRNTAAISVPMPGPWMFLGFSSPVNRVDRRSEIVNRRDLLRDEGLHTHAQSRANVMPRASSINQARV